MAMSQIINPGVQLKQMKISTTKVEMEIGVFAMMKSIVTFQVVVSSKLCFWCFENAGNWDPNLQWHEYYHLFVDKIQKKDLDGRIKNEDSWYSFVQELIDKGEFKRIAGL